MLPFHAKGGCQAIEDGAALSILLDQVKDKTIIEKRLQLFEQVRLNKGSALQIISNANPPVSRSVLNAAAKYVPGGSLESTDEVNEYIRSFDVIAESKAALAAI